MQESEPKEKHYGTALYKNPILFSKRQFKIMREGSLVKVWRGGRYILFGKKGYTPKIDKVKVMAEIRRLRGLLRRGNGK